MRNTHLLLAFAMTLAGCANNNPATSVTLGPSTASAPAAATVSAPLAAAAATVTPETSTQPATPPTAPPRSVAAGVGTSGAPVSTPAPGGGFATRHAYYEAARFTDLPGWNTDDASASWEAFRRSCTVLGTRNGWSEPCAASRAVDAHNPGAVRQFFETYFNAYQIRNTDKSIDGTLTGYYEPLLNGSRQYGGAYLYPVYGTPDDMLYLDARRLPDGARSGTLAARIDGRMVIPLPDVTTGNLKGVYVLDLRDSVPDIRDKKIRLRLDHDRIVPYYTRAEIERGALKAPILAYVDDPVMLYSMQVQGAGKVRMRDGSIRRFAYAEQNGRPFLPPVARNNQSGGHRITVRGLDMLVEVDAADDTPTVDAQTPNAANGTPAAAPQAPTDDDAPVSPLLRGFKLANATPSTTGSVAPAVGGKSGGLSTSGSMANGAGGPGPGSTGALAASTNASPVQHGFATSDPSYVFFRLIPDSPNGPVGALGVPLSAGRSVAVDPRTTPLGAPVFVATRDDPQSPGAIDRLMVAQDSGGAITGAVRADYFFGFGQSAQTQASHTKERIRMWVLLPKGLRIAAQDAATKTRGITPAVSNADCLVSDPELCVDDSP
jgi:membrane-bound lytic murein transglycosylase A